MDSITKEVLDIVEDLNNNIAERGSLSYYTPFEFKSGGWLNPLVYFMGEFIWSKENDGRDYIDETDEKEPLRDFLIKEAKIILEDLNMKMSFF